MGRAQRADQATSGLVTREFCELRLRAYALGPKELTGSDGLVKPHRLAQINLGH